ncbi:hypothetical protein HanXRQr2_Chr17g0784231 [Helianthus annuus]|uniref:NLP1-9 GAF domain-containing protein n=2 Tax=Helianthus annuus TaxID=4232 RepID=A0A9K3DES8_HELAN|nr:protein NLP6 isoform X2 [Helianthus annuus]KAF5753810.1 hypothetical protein HanXRQr2_Chr17g0784231 [Helianthus annuus]KAJ0427813.1 hypothetical protein HanHA300_Chr17g0639261 [Helianthus annuus]KAJ0431702.1 hypothetical protein HanIR_Chr17g0851251 [Helianthus annuus]KAJ0446112.1 hypothetical protein HanHA89_Chr17g0690771 [Helianthus annuus]
MSTTDLPFSVRDMNLWPFLKACRERHLDRSCGLVGKALLSRGSCFCGDVTKLSEAEYPLIHNARMYRLTSSFAIMCSVEADDDYVLKFYLPPDIRDSGQVSNLVQTLKHNIPLSSGFELGDKSCTVLSVNMEPDVIQTSSANPTNLSIEITSKKRKIESLTEMVTAEISHNNSNKKKIQFSVSMGLAYLENEVLRSFELKVTS